MCPAALDGILVFFFQTKEDGYQLFGCRDELVLQSQCCCNMQCSREGVIAALAHIDVIIGMAELFPGNLIGTVGNDFIGVHVGLRSASGLPDNQRKFGGKGSVDHFICGL